MLEQHFIDVNEAKPRHEIGIFGEINALAPRVAAADMKGDTDTRE